MRRLKSTLKMCLNLTSCRLFFTQQPFNMDTCSFQWKKSILVIIAFFVLIPGECRPSEKVTINKCCEFNETMLNNSCVNYDDSFSDDDKFPAKFLQSQNRSFADHYNFDAAFGCPEPKHLFDLTQDKDKFRVKLGGFLTWPNDKNIELSPDEYCLEVHDGEFFALTCQISPERQISDTIKTLGMLFSIPFLFVTLVVYLILPDKKIQTKCLMAYITCLMLSYFFLVYLQFTSSLPELACITLAACGIYFFMATFFWMNITCVDMYWTFSGKRTIVQGNSSKWKRFGLYCCFANGSPIVLLIIIFSLNAEQFKNEWYYPSLGVGQCWIADGYVKLLYFYGPMAILLIINTCLFVFTALTIRRTMVENQKMLRSVESQRHYDSNKQDYKLYIKLFIAMGINWIMEFISWIVDWSLGKNNVPPAIWYLTDFCNAIYGIFIFLLFICKRTVWIKLQQRYYIFMGKPNMARALSSRGTSGYQMSQTERVTIDDTTTTNVAGNHYHMQN